MSGRMYRSNNCMKRALTTWRTAPSAENKGKRHRNNLETRTKYTQLQTHLSSLSGVVFEKVFFLCSRTSRNIQQACLVAGMTIIRAGSLLGVPLQSLPVSSRIGIMPVCCTSTMMRVLRLYMNGCSVEGANGDRLIQLENCVDFGLDQ